MARIYPLFSSSSGNSYYIGNENGGVLVDAGVSCKKLVTALDMNGLRPECVKGIFVTHEHSDHIQGLSVFTKHYPVRIFSKKGTLEYMATNSSVSAKCELVEIDDKPIEFLGMNVNSFKTSHDAVDSCGFRFELADLKKLSVCTDLGFVSEEVERNLFGSDLVVLESNYDESMLRTGTYPFYLKQRIASNRGHLSNIDSSNEVNKLIRSGTTRIILGHLSRENNTPQIAKNSILRTVGELKEGLDYILNIAPVETDGMVVAF